MENYSVLQTVYKNDNPDFFRLSLISMLKQTIMPDEIVIVKDGEIPHLLQQVIEDLDKEYQGILVQVQLDKNVGLGLALNEGLKVCKNELVARMDSDDFSLPQRCEKELKMFHDDPELDIVGCQVKEFVDHLANVVGVRDVPLDNDSIHKYAKRRDPFNHPTVMFKKSKVLAYGPYKNYRKNQDTALWIDMLNNGCKAVNVPEYLLMFRFDKNTYKKRKSWVNTKLLIKIRKDAYRRKFCSFRDYFVVACAQLGIFILPVWFQKFIYRKVLRRHETRTKN